VSVHAQAHQYQGGQSVLSQSIYLPLSLSILLSQAVVAVVAVLAVVVVLAAIKQVDKY
jgi:hypothetical protein